MAKLVLLDAVISVNDVDLSDRAQSATINSEADLVEANTFGATGGYKQNLIGLKDGSIDVTFTTDEDAASVNATLWPLHQAGTVFAVSVKADSAATSATNPEYIMAEAVLPAFSPLAGDIGDLSTTDVTFQNAGQAGIVRSETPAP